MSHESERQRLLRELDLSRRRLAGDLTDLGHAVNVRERIEASVRKHPTWWIGGGILGGVLLANVLRSPGRRAKGEKDGSIDSSVKRSLFLGLLGLAGKQILRLSEPALKRYAQQEIERWMDSRSADSQTESDTTQNPPL